MVLSTREATIRYTIGKKALHEIDSSLRSSFDLQCFRHFSEIEHLEFYNSALLNFPLKIIFLFHSILNIGFFALLFFFSSSEELADIGLFMANLISSFCLLRLTSTDSPSSPSAA